MVTLVLIYDRIPFVGHGCSPIYCEHYLRDIYLENTHCIVSTHYAPIVDAIPSIPSGQDTSEIFIGHSRLEPAERLLSKDERWT